MNRRPPMLRLTPQVAGALQQRCSKTTTELLELIRYRKEFDRQLATLISTDTLRKLHKDTKNALLLADLVKEAA